MEIKWLGHACFLLEAESGLRLITDPYQSGAFGGAIGYGPVSEMADIVTVSHDHLDHGYTDDIKGAFTLIDKSGIYENSGIRIEGFDSWHDQSDGKLRGKNIIFKIEIDNIAICHLGDLGHKLDKETLESIKPVDVALVPVGGNFTIDSEEAASVVASLGPRLTIPMHYRNDKCQLEIDYVDAFIEDRDSVPGSSSSTLKIDKESLSGGSKVQVLTPAL